MDTDSEVAKFKWLLIAGVAFLVSGYFSYHEIKYMTWGKVADGIVTEARQTTSTGRRGRRIHKLRVDYQFPDDTGAQHASYGSLAVDAPYQSGSPIKIQYLRGAAEVSRINGEEQKWSLFVFFGSLIGMAYGIWQIAKLANDDPMERKRQRRSAKSLKSAR